MWKRIERPRVTYLSMATSSGFLFKQLLFQNIHLIILTILSSNPTSYASGCYTSFFSFGDSLSDTGNAVYLSHPTTHCAFFPNGETYFHHPTGRCCNGRLIIDFIAQDIGLPFLPPYFGIKNGSETGDIRQGVNFAVVGATALDAEFFDKEDIANTFTNVSMNVQLTLFKDMLPSLCLTSSSSDSDCNKFLESSLFILGPFGGNDYLRSLLAGKSLEDIQSYAPLVVGAIGSAVTELIKLGAVTIIIPGHPPAGCFAAYLTYFEGPDDEYDSFGCLIWLNKFIEYHNELLQIELNQIRQLHPHASVIYADYYSASMPFFRSPKNFGFSSRTHIACCGAGGPYNFNTSVACGDPSSRAFIHPFLFVNWDGWHFTEAACRWISKGLLEGPFTTPSINTLCLSTI